MFFSSISFMFYNPLCRSVKSMAFHFHKSFTCHMFSTTFPTQLKGNGIKFKIHQAKPQKTQSCHDSFLQKSLTFGSFILTQQTNSRHAKNPQTVLINLPQQKAAPPCYPISGSSHHIPVGSFENQPLLFLFLNSSRGGEGGELGRRSPVAP